MSNIKESTSQHNLEIIELIFKSLFALFVMLPALNATITRKMIVHHVLMVITSMEIDARNVQIFVLVVMMWIIYSELMEVVIMVAITLVPDVIKDISLTTL